jgi:hypothetical protein
MYRRAALPGVLAIGLTLAGLIAGSAASAYPPRQLSQKSESKINKNLPVRITTLTAKYVADRQVVTLHWVTSMEQNNEHFIIERSLDSLHFTEIGQARSVGNSRVTQHYYFDDPKPVGGKMYYRLREIDSSGLQFVTPVIEAFKPVTKLEVSAIHPSADGKHLNFAVISPKNSTASIVVADISGHVLKSFLMKTKIGANVQRMYIGDLSSGIFFLQVNDREGNGSVMGRFTHSFPEK